MRGRQFQLDRRNGKFLGVCAGLAKLTGIDATFIRIAAVIATLAGAAPWSFVAYFAAAWLGRKRSRSLFDDGAYASSGRSLADFRSRTSDMDRRLAEIDTYVAGSNSRLAREIEELR